jgi:hypothetical protein
MHRRSIVTRDLEIGDPTLSWQEALQTVQTAKVKVLEHFIYEPLDPLTSNQQCCLLAPPSVEYQATYGRCFLFGHLVQRSGSNHSHTAADCFSPHRLAVLNYPSYHH